VVEKLYSQWGLPLYEQLRTKLSDHRKQHDQYKQVR
jgi:hypothetical protein